MNLLFNYIHCFPRIFRRIIRFSKIRATSYHIKSFRRKLLLRDLYFSASLTPLRFTFHGWGCVFYRITIRIVLPLLITLLNRYLSTNHILNSSPPLHRVFVDESSLLADLSVGLCLDCNTLNFLTHNLL